VKRLANVTIMKYLMYVGAAVLAVGAASFLVLGVMIATAADAGEPLSVAITGMTMSAGFVLLILACIAACLGTGMPDFHDWAQTASASAIVADPAQSSRSFLNSANRFWAAAFPSRNKNHKLSFRP
jgi:hypothetical protein